LIHRHSRFGGLLPILSAVTAVAVLVAALLLVRWIGTSTAAPTSSNSRGAVPRAERIPFSATLVPSPTVSPEPTEEIDLQVAYEEAMRLAYAALVADDLNSARELFFLATQAIPDDPEATDRLRQVEIAQGIEERRTNWDEAMEELAELRSVVPFVPKVIDAHVTALVAVGREALDRNNRIRAEELCSEAVRSLPARTDARTCLLAAGGTPGVPFTPAPVGTIRPTATPPLVR
jgi:hypothetical protein